MKWFSSAVTQHKYVHLNWSVNPLVHLFKRHRLQFWVGFYFFRHILKLFPFCCSFHFLMFHNCFFLCIFLLNSFYYFKVFIWSHPEALEYFFLIVCFLMNVGTCIKSSKGKLLPILKKLFRIFTKICTFIFFLYLYSFCPFWSFCL